MRHLRRLREIMSDKYKSFKKWYIQNSNITFPITGIISLFIIIGVMSIIVTYSRIGLNQNIVNTDIIPDSVWYQQLVPKEEYDDGETYATYDDSITDFDGGDGTENNPYLLSNPKQLEFVDYHRENKYRLEDYMGNSAPKIVTGYFDYQINRVAYDSYMRGGSGRMLYFFREGITITNTSGKGIKHIRLVASSNKGTDGDVIGNSVIINDEEITANVVGGGASYKDYTINIDYEIEPMETITVLFDVTSYTTRTTYNISTFEITTTDDLLYYSRGVYQEYHNFYYKMTNSFDMEGIERTPIGNSTNNRFEGHFDGDYHTIKNIKVRNNDNMNSDRSYGFFGEVYDATIKNITLDNVDVVATAKNRNYNLYVGALAGRVSGNSKIYNIGVKSGLITYNGGTIQQNGAVGGIVGMLTLADDKRPAIVNCYSFADVNASGSSGSTMYIAGIVGNRDGCINGQNNGIWHNEMIKGDTVVYLLSYYGKITATDGINYQFVYNGTRVDMDKSPCYCYYLYRDDNKDTNDGVGLTYAIMKSYEEMTGDGYRAHMNNYRYMASYYLGFDNNPRDNKASGYPEIAKWTLNNNRSLFPMLEKYSKKVVTKYDDFETSEAAAAARFGVNNYIKVNLRNTSNNNATTTIYLKIEGKDESVNDYVNRKIILPFNNKNVYNAATDSFRKPVSFNYYGTTSGFSYQISGWKLKSVIQDGITISSQKNPANNNFVLREGSDAAAKDINTVYAQGGYYLVPYGVTEVTFDTEWARVFYVMDRANDHVYNTLYAPQNNSESKYGLTNGSGNSGSGKTENSPIVGLYNAYQTANSNQWGDKNSGYSYMFVLVGNLHLDSMSNTSNAIQTYAELTKDKASYWPNINNIDATITSIDSDGDFEPDFSFYIHNYHDMDWPAVRFDFVNVLGFAQVGTINGKLNEITLRNSKPFEVTETVATDRIDLRHQDAGKLILNGGYWNIYNIWGADSHDATNVKKYMYFGGNARAAYLNCGQESTATADGRSTKIPTIVVAGGRIDTLSATYFNAYVAVNNEAYFFVDGGYINNFYTTYKAPLNQGAHVEITGSYINKYFSGGSSDYAIIKGGVSTIIKESRISEVYGGPEFGEIRGGSKLEIYDSLIDNVYGGGYGGTQTTEVDQSYNDTSCDRKSYTYNLVNNCNNTNAGSYCLGKKNASGAYQTGFTAMVYSKGGCPCSVFARKYSTLSTATVDNVELDMKDDEVINDIYGGGNKGVVSKKVLMNLENVVVRKGSIYGGGVSNENETVQVIDEVQDTDKPKFISYTIDSETKYSYKTLIWSADANLNRSSINYHNDTHIYSANVPNLGKVNGDIFMNIKNVTVNKSIYGGGNAAPVNADIHLNVSGDTTSVGDYIFGGGNQATVTGDIDTRIIGGEYDTVFGAGNKGAVNGTATLTIQSNAKVDNVFGGGNEADATNTEVYYAGGTSENVYGGSNSTGTVTKSNVNIGIGNPNEMLTGINTEPDESSDIEYGTLALTRLTGSDNDWTAAQINVKNNSTSRDYAYFTIRIGIPTSIVNGSDFLWNGQVYNTSKRTSGTTFIYEITTAITSWGQTHGANHGQEIHLSDNYPIKFLRNNARVSGNINYSYYTIYGYDSDGNIMGISSLGGDPLYIPPQEPEEPEPIVPDISEIHITNVYGGNNAGGITTTSNVLVSGTESNVENVYGGGNQAPTGSANVTIKDAKGPQDIYGGGKLGVVNNNTNVIIDNANVSGNIFGGGEGAAAIVNKNTNVQVRKGSIIDGNVFGGGDAANTGIQANNNSISKVDVLGGTIKGNVYGGGNTAIIYGTGNVNIGSSTDTETGRGPITINGTVFGGGESSEAGSQKYDYSFNSVTQGINININGTDTNPVFIKGSIFGSGNAANSGGYSHINITHLGTRENPNVMSSIQRADDVNIYDSAILLEGATDSPNEFDYYLYSMSRINSLTIANNTSLYLEHDFNLVEEFNSLYVHGSTREKATATIEDGVVTKNVDNRLYSSASKSNSINIRNTESEVNAEYQDVNGMTYFGLYISDSNGNINEGIYDPSVANGDVVPENIATLFKAGSYVRGRHKANHDKTVDGFYSNFADPETFEIKTDYVPVTSEEFQYYEWAIGEQTTDYDIDLIASKYATTGTGVIEFAEYNVANTYFQIIDFGGGALAPGVTLEDANTIPRIAETDEEAIQKFGLKMASNSDSWLTNGQSEFFYDGTSSTMSGTTMYYTDNSANIPAFEFYLTHSRNINIDETLGTAVICMIAYVPQDALTYKLVRININVNIRSIVEEANGYDGAMTSGRRTEIFVNGNTNISNKSQLSSYYSLFMDGNSFADGGYRYIESTYKLPVNTRITMIDRSNEDIPVYYYYVVTEDNYDVPYEDNIYTKTNSPVPFYQYYLSDFVRMGSVSDDNTFSDEDSNINNYYADKNISAEEYIFTFDFSEADITESVGSAELFLTYQKEDVKHTQLSTFRASSNNTLFNIIKDGEASLILTLPGDNDIAYVGQESNIPFDIKYQETLVSGRRVADTQFSQDKLGLKITLYNSDNNKVTGTSLLGTLFYVNNIPYSSNIDGSVRLKVADNVANVNSSIVMDLSKSNLATDTYRMVVEAFGSPDGLYFGRTDPFVVEKTIKIVNEKYGLRSTIDEKYVIIDGKKGLNTSGNNNLNFNIEYSSRFNDPNIRVRLYRRNYDEKYSLDYSLVDLQDYVSTELIEKQEDEYLVTQTPEDNILFSLLLNENLVTGTYKVVFEIYNGDNYIDSVFNYIFIK